MLKISQHDGSGAFTLKIEGKVIGEWAVELERIWATLMPSLGSKKLFVDICGVTYLDDRGRGILREIFEVTGAEILADSTLTKQFADEAQRKVRKHKDGSTREGRNEHAEPKRN